MHAHDWWWITQFLHKIRAICDLQNVVHYIISVTVRTTVSSEFIIRFYFMEIAIFRDMAKRNLYVNRRFGGT
jgi:hypothetical protein